MQVHHDRPQSDLSYHIHAPLFLKIKGGNVVRIEEWSLAGLIYPKTAGELPSKVSLTIPFQGVDLQFPVHLKASGKGRELLFDKLTVRQRETLAVFYKSILTGRMATTEDMIVSLDTPVDLVPMEETEAERQREVAEAPSRLLRVIWSLTFYLCLAVLVFGVAGRHIWTRLNTIRLSQSRILATIQTYSAPESAYVDDIAVILGQKIKRNDLLVKLSSPVLDGHVNSVRAEISDAERRLALAEDRLHLHDLKAGPERRAILRALQPQMAKRRIADFLGGYDLAEILQLKLTLEAFDAQRSLTLGDYADVRQQLAEMAGQYRADWRHLKRELSNRKSIARSLDIVATADGIVVEVISFKDIYVHRGDRLLVVEANVPRLAVGMLDERLSDAVHLGMLATIGFDKNGVKQKISGRIVDIQAQEILGGRGDISLIVTVEVQGLSAAQTRKTFRSNMPISLKLHRNLLGGMTKGVLAHADA